MSTPRLPDWCERLGALFAERLRLPFAWGTNDCVLFAADAVRAVSGRDLAAGVRGSYSDARGAARLLVAWGGLAGLATAQLGEPIGPLFAGVGDVGLVEHEGRELMAVCNGTYWLAPGALGLGAMELGCARLAWRT